MAIYGECISASGRAVVEVTELALSGCRLLAKSANALLEGEAALWIGAIGPLNVTTVRSDDRSGIAQFSEPLDPRIVEHFNCG